jgi:hypothetical protein
MRDEVDRERLEAFLRALGSAFRRPGRLYLSGGESMVWRGLRNATRDVDIAYDVDPAHEQEWVRAIRQLKERLRINVEEADPAHFVPLPPGAEGRAEHVGRYGEIDVYLYDAYSVALSKLARGHARDLSDVRALLDVDVLDGARLEELTEAAIASGGDRSLRFDPRRVRRHLRRVLGDPDA